MPVYIFGDTQNGAIVHDGLADAVKRILDKLDDGVGARVLERVEDIVDTARPQVPVKTGKLRASLDSYIRTTESDIAVGAKMGGTRAPYAYQVAFKRPRRLALGPRRKGVLASQVFGPRQYDVPTENAGKNVFATLIRRPMQRAIDEVANDVVAAMVEAVG